MDSIPDILADLRAGKMIVLVDDEQRENEGDLVCAAQFVTPQIINFMLQKARGVLCLAMTGHDCDRLELSPQSSINTTQRSTAFTVTIDAHERFGLTTGVSSADRAKTIQVAGDPASKPDDLARPGHINPLRARNGGVLVRAGQTEGSVDLCKLAGLLPSAAIIEVMNDDGSMARLPDLETLCKTHDLKICSVADIIHYRLEREKLVQRIDEAPFQTPQGEFRLIAYDSAVDALPHVALVKGDSLGQRDSTGQPIEVEEPVLVRMHSQNLLGDVFGDLSQPSGSTLEHAMEMIQREGVGAVVYLRHEKMGSGLLRRLQTLRSPSGSLVEKIEEGDGPFVGQSQTRPGVAPPSDTGDYGIGSQILRDLGIRQMKLITNHPFHPKALQGFGLEISEFVPVR